MTTRHRHSPSAAAASTERHHGAASIVARGSGRFIEIGFTVSFAVLLNDAKARELAAKIVVDGKAARVVTGINEGTAVYRSGARTVHDAR